MKHPHCKFLIILVGLSGGVGMAAPGAEIATTEEGIVGTYRKAVPDVDFETSKARDEKNKPRVAQRQREVTRRTL